jgi:hypothetical protein
MQNVNEQKKYNFEKRNQPLKKGKIYFVALIPIPDIVSYHEKTTRTIFHLVNYLTHCRDNMIAVPVYVGKSYKCGKISNYHLDEDKYQFSTIGKALASGMFKAFYLGKIERTTRQDIDNLEAHWQMLLQLRYQHREQFQGDLIIMLANKKIETGTFFSAGSEEWRSLHEAYKNTENNLLCLEEECSEEYHGAMLHVEETDELVLKTSTPIKITNQTLGTTDILYPAKGTLVKYNKYISNKKDEYKPKQEHPLDKGKVYLVALIKTEETDKAEEFDVLEYLTQCQENNKEVMVYIGKSYNSQLISAYHLHKVLHKYSTIGQKLRAKEFSAFYIVQIPLKTRIEIDSTEAMLQTYAKLRYANKESIQKNGLMTKLANRNVEKSNSFVAPSEQWENLFIQLNNQYHNIVCLNQGCKIQHDTVLPCVQIKATNIVKLELQSQSQDNESEEEEDSYIDDDDEDIDEDDDEDDYESEEDDEDEDEDDDSGSEEDNDENTEENSESKETGDEENIEIQSGDEELIEDFYDHFVNGIYHDIKHIITNMKDWLMYQF